MKECIDFESVIPEYLDGELEASLCREFEAHIEECPSCKKALEEMRELLADISESAYEVPFELKENVMSRITAEYSQKNKKRLVRILGGIAACIVVTVGVISVLPHLDGNIESFTDYEADAFTGVPEPEAPSSNGFTEGDYDDYNEYYDDYNDCIEQGTVTEDIYESVPEDNFLKNESVMSGSNSDIAGSTLVEPTLDGAFADSTYDDFEDSYNCSESLKDVVDESLASDSSFEKGNELDYGVLFMTRGAASLAEIFEENE